MTNTSPESCTPVRWSKGVCYAWIETSRERHDCRFRIHVVLSGPPTSSLQDWLEGHWLLLHALAITAATVHANIESHIGLFGASSSVVSPPQAGLAFGMSLLTALWAIGLGWAALEEARGHATVSSIALLWALLGNGVVFAACPPPV